MKRKRPRQERDAREIAEQEERLARGAGVLEGLGYTRAPDGSPSWLSPLAETMFVLGYAREPAWVLVTAESRCECRTETLAVIAPKLVEAERLDLEEFGPGPGLSAYARGAALLERLGAGGGES